MKSPLRYIGGKSRLAEKIVSRIPCHKTYCEVFAGAAWVFFRKEPSPCEIINDIDGDLVAFYRVLQNHFEEFIKQFKWLLVSRDWWGDWKRQQQAGGLTDIQRAARYYYLQRLCFGGRVKGRTFGTAKNRLPAINLVRLEEDLSDIHLRLASTVVENLPWQKVVAIYDSPDTFFYLDPPYYKAPFYKENLRTKSDFDALASALSKIKGRFLLSINDHLVMRDAFKQFKITRVKTAYSVSRAKFSTVREMLVSG